MRTIGLAAALGALALAIPAQAATPNGAGLDSIDAATCDGVPGAVLHSQGPSFWFGGTHYVALTFTFTQGGQSNTKGVRNEVRSWRHRRVHSRCRQRRRADDRSGSLKCGRSEEDGGGRIARRLPPFAAQAAGPGRTRRVERPGRRVRRAHRQLRSGDRRSDVYWDEHVGRHVGGLDDLALTGRQDRPPERSQAGSTRCSKGARGTPGAAR